MPASSAWSRSAGISSTNPQALALGGRAFEALQLLIDEIRDDRRHQHPMRVVPHAHRPALPEKHDGRGVEDDQLDQQQACDGQLPSRSIWTIAGFARVRRLSWRRSSLA